MIRGYDIIFISSIDWDDQWQAPQELALRLSKAGNRILYIENTGIRAPGLRDTRRVMRRLKHWGGALRRQSVRPVLLDLWVHAPLVLPPFSSALLSYVNRHLLLAATRRAARRLGMRDPLIWTFLPTDTTLSLLDLLGTPRSRVIYYCAADFAHLTTSVQQLARSEAELVKRSDVVFTICDELSAHCLRWNNNVHVFPYGVNLKSFPLQNSDLAQTSRPEHGKFSWTTQSHTNGHNGHKVVGYVGGLHRHVNVNMLVEMARARPAWSWVFVGSPEVPLKELAKLPNVYLLGQRPHHDLAHYIRTFDACIVPYRRSAYTETVVPSKINEYLAMGKPVVSTNLPPVCDFNDKHQVLVTAEEHPESFLRAIEHALRLGEDAALLERRRAVARQGDWDARLEAMSELIVSEHEGKGWSRSTRTGVDTNNKIEEVSLVDNTSI
jgi:glycosyltransferase involved in cell wall biosynthesis